MPLDFLGLFALLNHAKLRYVVTGGLAAVLHGVDRLTADVDLAIDLSADAPQALVTLLTESGYRPAAPVDAMGLANPDVRAHWMQQQHMKVFSFWDVSNSRPTIDVMLDNPVPFDELHARSVEVAFRGTSIRVAGIADLISMKRYAGRPRDIDDIARLEEILQASRAP